MKQRLAVSVCICTVVFLSLRFLFLLGRGHIVFHKRLEFLEMYPVAVES